MIRLGRVKRIDPDEIVLEGGAVPSRPNRLYVDCSADALEKRPVAPVFDGERIMLQTVRACQQVFSAAFIGHVEAAYRDETQKNELCTVVPHPNTDLDFLRVTLANARSDLRWSQDAELTASVARARLNVFGVPPAAMAGRRHRTGRWPRVPASSANGIRSSQSARTAVRGSCRDFRSSTTRVTDASATATSCVNTTHVGETLEAMQWRPPGVFHMPPRQPNRDVSLPAAWAHFEASRSRRTTG